ncbi:MAG: hypothetical protein N2447_06345 [Thermoanaerobaculum sp.]|nr:hypothetical protein [Thermoanaerobaculum sp.]
MTRGQFGSAKDSVENTSQYRNFFVTATWKPSTSFQLMGEVALTRGTEMMDQIRMNVPADVLAKLPWSDYDLSLVHTFSNLDTKRWDVNLTALTRLAKSVDGILSYSLVKYEDMTPYVADLTGELSMLQLGLRWTL